MKLTFQLVRVLGAVALWLATGQVQAVEKSRAELELEKRAKKTQAEREYKAKVAEFQEVVATAYKQGAKKLDWSLVPAEGDKDWDQKQAAFHQHYKDATLVFDGILGKFFNYGSQETNFILYHPTRRGVKLLVFVRDIDQQSILKTETPQFHIQAVGKIKGPGSKAWVATLAAEYVGEYR